MNFLFYAPQMAEYGGMETHICTLAATASARGHHVQFLTTSNSLGRELRQELERTTVVFRELPVPRMQAAAWRKLTWLFKEVRVVRQQPWDVIYTNGQSALARVAWFASRQGNTRIVHHHHTAADSDEQKTWSRGFRRVLARAPGLVACSDATRDKLNSVLGRNDVRYLPYLTRCPVTAENIGTRRPHTPLRFGFTGRLIPEKGIEIILRLATEPSLADIDWHIHGAGTAYPPDVFSNRPRVVYHGAYRSLDEHASALLAMDALVLFSTHNEGMPLSLIEGMSAGLPLIATDRGGTRELARSASDTMIVPADASYETLVGHVRAHADAINSGSTSRIRQRAVYDQFFAPPIVAGRWLDYFTGTKG